MSNDMFKNVEKKTGVDIKKASQLANSFKGKNINDEKTARELVKQVGKLAGKKVPKTTEDMIVNMLVKNKVNESTIKKMLK
ncbi:stage VI sporulation protein F [Aquibacillus salsiterrae]|uniref:Stage VI sporulation protein F n=1 Tax=Aquibacillus salsiterrae TaxID=2950439 RepID=A0A9X3WIF1_9BACI|nr:stage VI sporulation protein F [Aquibacillus salsiterrae]MDC3417964.1 stage VI sporulation protein F [Aquibacillus salsiterrae]